MHATLPSFRATPARRTGLIVAAILVAAALAAGAALLQPPRGATGTHRRARRARASRSMPVGGVDSASPRDPSVPSAASVFQGKVIVAGGARRRLLSGRRRQPQRNSPATGENRGGHRPWRRSPITSARRRRRSSCAVGRRLLRARLRLRRARRHGGIGAPARRRRACRGQDPGDAGRLGAAADRADARRPEGEHQEPGAGDRREVGRALRSGGGRTAQRLPGRRHLAFRHEKADAGLRRADGARARPDLHQRRPARLPGRHRSRGADQIDRRAAGALRRTTRQNRRTPDRPVPPDEVRLSVSRLARRLPDRLAVVRGHHQPGDGPRRSAQLRLRQPGRDQRAALGQQEGGDRDARARCAQGRGAGARGALGGTAPRPDGRRGRMVCRACRLRRLPRPPLAAVLPLQGRQGRGHRGRRAAGDQPLARPGDGGHLGDHRLLLPLLVARLAGLGGVRAVLPAADLGRRARSCGHRRDVAAALLAPRANIAKLLAGTESKLGGGKGGGTSAAGGASAAKRRARPSNARAEGPTGSLAS